MSSEVERAGASKEGRVLREIVSIGYDANGSEVIEIHTVQDEDWQIPQEELELSYFKGGRL